MGSAVVDLWPQYKMHVEAARLLLCMAWLGDLSDCVALAYEAATDKNLDDVARVFAARALLRAGDSDWRKSYADVVIAEAMTLPQEMVRDAIADLFPTFISVSDLLQLLESSHARSENGGLRFGSDGPGLVDKLSNAADVEDLLRGLLAQVGGELQDHTYHPLSEREQALFPAIAGAALRLLQMTSPEIAPSITIDALLRLCNRRDHEDASAREATDAALKELHKTAERRRRSFWHVAHTLRNSPNIKQKIDEVWDMEFLGYSSGLQGEDLDWLLSDGLEANDECDHRLAVDAAVRLYRSAGAPSGMREKISSAVNDNTVASEVYQELTRMSRPSPQHDDLERRSREIEKEHETKRAKRDKSWSDFIRDLTADKERIARLRTPPLPSDRNADLLGLWQLLDGARTGHRYAIDTVAPLQRIAGSEVAEAAKAGFIAQWRHSPPRLKSLTTGEERNRVRYIDLMGLVGVTLEAASVSGWAQKLSSSEASRAAGYATLELNGFPPWLFELASSKPAEVCSVLLSEIVHEITSPELDHCETLQKVAHVGENIGQIVAPGLLDEIDNRPELPSGALSAVLQIISKGLRPADESRFLKLGLEQFQQESNSAAAMQYLAALFTRNPQSATEALTAKIDGLMDAREQAAIVDQFFRTAFGDSSVWGSLVSRMDLSPETLEALVLLAFRAETHRPRRTRRPGVAYDMDDTDMADQARGAVFNRFVKTPGAATYQALMRLHSDPTCPVSSARLRALAEERACWDSEVAPWVPSDVVGFERHHETIPRTAKDLQSVLLTRIEDIQHDLLHGDFAQGRTLQSLPDESEVQKWIADRLRLKQGRAFSLEREPHVVDEKEPDIRIRAKAADANVAVEIKVAESWTLTDLEDALQIQLCGQYLRANNGRLRIPAKPITIPGLCRSAFRDDADHRRSEATLACFMMLN